MTTIKSILYVIGLFLIPMFFINLFFYLIGSFIAQDWNPSNWLLFTTVWGRIIFIVVEMVFLVRSPELIEEL
jgi:hypothetical protein